MKEKPKKKQKRSELEISFEINFAKKLKRAGFTVETQYEIPGHLFKYDFRFCRCRTPFGVYDEILLEIDGNGRGHTTVAARERDARKGNVAVQSGFQFFRLTGKHFQRGLPTNYVHELVDWIIKGR